jgi:hypothetical protein
MTTAPTFPVPQQSFIDWVVSQATSMHGQQLVVYLVVGFLGIFAHWLKNYLNDEYDKSFWHYLVGDKPKSTVVTLSSFIGSGLTYMYTGTIASASWPALLGLAFTTGYSFDSLLNKSTKSDSKKSSERNH